MTRWWFQIFFLFIPTWGRFPFWLIFFKWVENHQLDDDFEDDGEQKVYWKFQNDFWPHVGSENEGNPKAVVEAKQVIPGGLIQMRI